MIEEREKKMWLNLLIQRQWKEDPWMGLVWFYCFKQVQDQSWKNREPLGYHAGYSYPDFIAPYYPVANS